MAPRIEQDPLQLLDVRPDEVEQRLSRLRPDVAFQGGDRRRAAPDQLRDHGRLALARGSRPATQWPRWTPARQRPYEAVDTPPPTATELIGRSEASIAALERDIRTK